MKGKRLVDSHIARVHRSLKEIHLTVITVTSFILLSALQGHCVQERCFVYRLFTSNKGVLIINYSHSPGRYPCASINKSSLTINSIIRRGYHREGVHGEPFHYSTANRCCSVSDRSLCGGCIHQCGCPSFYRSLDAPCNICCLSAEPVSLNGLHSFENSQFRMCEANGVLFSSDEGRVCSIGDGRNEQKDKYTNNVF